MTGGESMWQLFFELLDRLCAPWERRPFAEEARRAFERAGCPVPDDPEQRLALFILWDELTRK